MKVTWQAEALPADPHELGHGVGIVGPADEPRLVAFVDGFGWWHQGADAVVLFQPEHFPTGETGDRLRTAVEAFLRARRRNFLNEIAPGYRPHVNG